MSDERAKTLERTLEPSLAEAENAQPKPGLALIFTAGRPCMRTIPLAEGQIEIGRDHPALSAVADHRISRRHVKILHDGRQFFAADLGSSNGTSADGVAIAAHRSQVIRCCLRLGDSLFIPVSNIDSFASYGVKLDGERVLGPALQGVLAEVARAAQHGQSLHIAGESGVGKEGIARAFHEAAAAPRGRFVAVNCATIPEGIAERLLFGAKRGAYSGIDADAEGYVQAADGGTLFLDEVAELTTAIQAKLLRVLESKEVTPIGATRARQVTLQVCSATNQDLRRQVEAGRLRQDLYFRIAQPSVTVPALRQRGEEVPWLLQYVAQLIAPELPLHISFVETCLLRPWPGNIRELLAEARSAVHAAMAQSAARLEGRHWRAEAGAAFNLAEVVPASTPAQPPVRSGQASTAPNRAAIEQVLHETGGNISAAARLLKVHRQQLHRWLARYSIVVRREDPSD